MKFKVTTIAPSGRNKYGNYYSGSNVTRAVTSTIYDGNGSTNDMGGGNNDNTGGGGNRNDKDNFLLFLSRTAIAYDGMLVAVSDVTESVNLIGYRGQQLAQTFVGDINQATEKPNYGILGIPQGMTVTVEGNGTTSTVLKFTVNKAIQNYSGVLTIPVAVNTSEDTLETVIGHWNQEKKDCVIMWLECTYSVSTASDSSYVLELDNDSAGINCDKDGNILAGAVRPTCKATLYYGTSAVSEGVSYGLILPSSQSVVGVTIDTASGQLTFGSNFNFVGTPLEIGVTASISGNTVGSKKMTITKMFAGSDGTPSTTRWIVLSSNSVKYNPNTKTTLPATISAKVMKQVGEQSPVEDSATTIYYDYNNTTPSIAYTSPITVDATKDYISFALKTGSTIYELETVSILKDGSNGGQGDKGDQGLKGASVRGAVNYYTQTNNRWFCDGTEDSRTPESAMWLDVILKDNKYYYCNTTYYGSANDDWSTVSKYWTEGAEKFDFIATHILLADNAGIQFLSTNQITLLDDSGTQIVGGAQGGTGVNFWAGSQTPTNANFQVKYDGSIIAKSGTFAGYIQMPYTFITDLSAIENQGYKADERAYLIADSFSANSNDGTLLLPEPSEELNGFTYHIVVVPYYETRTSTYQRPVLSLKTINNSTSMQAFTLTSKLNAFEKMTFYGGHIEITCMPVHGARLSSISYNWVITLCTGGMDCYGRGGNYLYSFNTVSSFSTESPESVITKIQSDSAIPSIKNYDTLYIQRQ